MGGIVDAIVDAVSTVYDAIEGVVSAVWNDVVVPALGEVFSWFGIVDEYIVTTAKTSVLIFEGNIDEDPVNEANIRAVMDMTSLGGSFFPWYMKETRQIQGQIKAFYRYAEQERYIHGLPNMEIKGNTTDFTVVNAALDTEKGAGATLITTAARVPENEIYFMDKLQATPTFYIPHANTLTADDLYGVSWDDWQLGVMTYQVGDDTWDIAISRTAEQALFWIEGPVHIVEGDTATYTIYSNRTVPAGESVDIDLVYSGTADPLDYAEVLSVTMLESTDSISFDVVTDVVSGTQSALTMIVTIDAVDNGAGVFEDVGIYAIDSVTTTITDSNGKVLTMPSVVAAEATGTVDVDVTLQTAASGTFDVDYVLSNGTALGGGVDFDSTGGTLTFAGTVDEVQTITIPITTADGDDDNEYFTVSLTNCTDATIDITRECTVVISDGSDAGPVAGTSVVEDVIVEAGYLRERSLIIEWYDSADTPAEWFYWVYKFSDETYPGIDPQMSVLSNLDMLPIGILRRNKTFINWNKDSTEYRTTKRLLDIMFLDIEDIIDGLAENPGISDVDDVFINFAVSPSSTVEPVSQLLWLMFYNIVVINGVTSNTNEYSASFDEQDVQNAVVWTEHTHTTGHSGTLTGSRIYEHEIIDNGDSTELVIKHQSSAGVYEQLSVHNLSGMASIAYGGYSNIAWNRIGDPNFTMPVSFFIIDQMSPTEQLAIYQHILRLDIYSIQITVVDWYNTSIFQDLMQIVAIVITVWTAGLAGGIWAVIQQLVINYVIMEVVVFLAEETGNAELAAIVGLVAIVALGGASGMPAFDFASAQGLVNASTEFADNLALGYNTLGEGVLEDMTDLNNKAQERLDEINDATPEEGPIDADFLVALQRVDTRMYPAVKAQYDFDLLYNYDRIIADYYNANVSKGVI